MKSPCQTSPTCLVMSWALHLAGVSLWPGSESRRPMILQVTRTSATTQKMKQLVPYMIIAGRLTTEPVHLIMLLRSDRVQFGRLQNFSNQWLGHQRICFLLFWGIFAHYWQEIDDFMLTTCFQTTTHQAIGLLVITLCLSMCHEQISSTHLVYQTC